MGGTPAVRELRLVVTAADYGDALRFYRDVLGLTERASYSSPGGHVTILEAGRATIELTDPTHAEFIDAVEVGSRVAGHIRVALEVDDTPAVTRTLAEAGAKIIAEPTRTPWGSLARLAGPAGLQLTLFTESTAVEARAAAHRAVQRHGLRIVELGEIAEFRAIAQMLARIWRVDSPDQIINTETMRALTHSGNYVVAAYRADRLVGAAIAFFGADHLHSHITGVDPAGQRGGVGYALKQHQRAWALARGITRVCWTFDPLVLRNAYFNLHKLGAGVTEYLAEFYGEMTDGINAGDASDRLYVRWDLTSPRAVAAAAGDPGDVDATALRAAGATVLVDRAGQEPVRTGAEPPTGGRAALVAVPPDIEGLRVRDPERARQWRFAVRDALTAALGAGLAVNGVSRDGFYVLCDTSPGN